MLLGGLHCSESQDRMRLTNGASQITAEQTPGGWVLQAKQGHSEWLTVGTCARQAEALLAMCHFMRGWCNS